MSATPSTTSPPDDRPDNPDNPGSLQANLDSRRAKLARLRERGLDPYPPRFNRTHTAAAAIALFERSETGAARDAETAAVPPAPAISVAGRIVSMRVMGRAAFLDLRDGSGVIQAMLRRNALGDDYAPAARP